VAAAAGGNGLNDRRIDYVDDRILRQELLGCTTCTSARAKRSALLGGQVVKDLQDHEEPRYYSPNSGEYDDATREAFRHSSTMRT
jgi:hypothetical protein